MINNRWLTGGYIGALALFLICLGLLQSTDVVDPSLWSWQEYLFAVAVAGVLTFGRMLFYGQIARYVPELTLLIALAAELWIVLRTLDTLQVDSEYGWDLYDSPAREVVYFSLPIFGLAVLLFAVIAGVTRRMRATATPAVPPTTDETPAAADIATSTDSAPASVIPADTAAGNAASDTTKLVIRFGLIIAITQFALVFFMQVAGNIASLDEGFDDYGTISISLWQTISFAGYVAGFAVARFGFYWVAARQLPMRTVRWTLIVTETVAIVAALGYVVLSGAFNSLGLEPMVLFSWLLFLAFMTPAGIFLYFPGTVAVALLLIARLITRSQKRASIAAIPAVEEAPTPA